MILPKLRGEIGMIDCVFFGFFIKELDKIQVYSECDFDFILILYYLINIFSSLYSFFFFGEWIFD